MNESVRSHLERSIINNSLLLSSLSSPLSSLGVVAKANIN